MKQITSITSAVILGISAAFLITKYSFYIAFIAIAIIVGVGSHIIIDKLIDKDDE